jgi:hypothetical protein
MTFFIENEKTTKQAVVYIHLLYFPEYFFAGLVLKFNLISFSIAIVTLLKRTVAWKQHLQKCARGSARMALGNRNLLLL